MAGTSPLVDGLRAPPTALWKKQCLSSASKVTEFLQAKTQGRVNSRREIPFALSADLPTGVSLLG